MNDTSNLSLVIKALGYESSALATPEAHINGVANLGMLEELSSESQHEGAGITFDHLRMMTSVPLIASIVNTRVNQVAEFGVPCKDGSSIGFQIKLRDGNRSPTEMEQQTIEDIYRFIESCGDPRLGSDVSFEVSLEC